MSGTAQDERDFVHFLKTGEHPEDECACGDYRRQHDNSGCRVCGNSRAPYDGCTKFRLAKAAMTTKGNRIGGK